MIHQRRNNRRTGIKTYEQSVADFWLHVDSSALDDPLSCWNWIGKTRIRNYGVSFFQGQRMLAHRASFIVHNGAIPNGLEVCHRCDNPSCVNPNHLFLGTHKDNMSDASRKKRFVNSWRGSKHTQAKLTESDIPKIRLARMMREPLLSVSAKFNVSPITIRRVWSGETWAHVKNDLQPANA